MILRSISVANWRCFVEPVELGPFREGLNVLHSPNSTGKSTLFRALVRGLLDVHAVTGNDIEAVRPWGRRLSPTVTVAFAHGGIEYRITKQFLEGCKALLECREEGRYRPLAEGDAADKQVRDMLTQNPPGRGLAKPKNWGLAQALWAPQGALALDELSGDVVGAIQSALGAQLSGPGGGSLEKKIEELYLEFFTPKTGELRKGKDAPEAVRLQENLAAAKEKRAKALETQEEFEEAVRRVEDLRAQHEQAKRDATELRKTLDEARSRADSYRELRSQEDQHKSRADAAEAQYHELKQRTDQIRKERKELSKAEAKVADLEGKLPVKEKETRECQREAARTKAAVEDARKKRQAVEEAQQEAQLAERHVEVTRKLTELGKLLERIEGARGNFEQLKAERRRLVAPDNKQLRAIRKTIRKRDEAQVRIDAALITMEIVPKKKGALIVVDGEETGEHTLESDTPIQVKGSPAVVAELPGVARLRAWGPSESADKPREERERAEAKLRKLTEPFGTTEIDELEALRDQAKELDQKVAKAETQLETLLSDRELEDIQTERSQAGSALEKLLEMRPEWEQTAPESGALKAAAEEVERSFIAEVEQAEAEAQKAQAALAAVEKERANLSAELKAARSQAKSLGSTLSELTSDGKEDAEREEELKNTALSWEAEKAKVEEVQKAMADYPDDPTKAAEKLEKQMAAAGEAARQALKGETREEARLEHLSASGPYTGLALAEEEVTRLEEEIAREQLRLDGIRLLYRTVETCRAEAIVPVAKPVQEHATRTLERIAGRRLGPVELGDAFEPTHVLPDSAGTEVSLDNVSGGEAEQIHLATRLALAEVLAKDERQLVVLDDILTATDPGRLARITSILEETAEHLQLLVLTCHPARYRALEDASFFDLEGILREKAAERG